MGKIAIITFDDSEDIAMERICSILVGEEQFEEVKLGQGFVLTFSELKINEKEKNVYLLYHLICTVIQFLFRGNDGKQINDKSQQ